jgi:hypothetical protein
MERSSQITWKIVPLRHFFPLKVVPLIEVLLYSSYKRVGMYQFNVLHIDAGLTNMMLIIRSSSQHLVSSAKTAGRERLTGSVI